MTAKTTLLALFLTGSSLCAQIPSAKSGVVATNKDDALRQALRQALDGTAANAAAPAPARIASNAGAADVPGLPPGPGTGTGTGAADPAIISSNGIAQPGNPATPGPANRVSVPSNPAATNLPANRLAVPSNPALPGNPGAGPAGTVATPSPAVPGAVPGSPPVTPTVSPDTTNASQEDIIPAGVINFAAVDIQEVLKIYAELVNRTILRPTALPATVITLRTQTALTKKEAIQALDAVLALNGVAVIPVGEKFVKVVGSPQANQVGAAFNKQEAKDLPEMGSYVTHVLQVTNVKPSELLTVLQPFASQIPNPILAIDGSQMLVLRDYAENVKRMLELVAKIDVAVPAEYISEVIPIKYALASEISSALNSLSAGGGGTTVGQGTGAGGIGAGGGGARRSTSGGGFGTGQRSLGGAGGVGGYGGLGGQGQYGQQGVQTGVGGMATPGAGGGFTDRLRSIIQRASTSGEIQVIGQTKIIADERTNSLLIFASRLDMEIIKKIISQLDVVLAQVLIETVIIEVTLGPDTKNFGFSYIQPPRNLLGNTLGEGAGGAGQFLSPGFTALGSGTNAGSGGLTGGFNYLFTHGQDLDVTVTALESSSKAKILQRPRIQTSHAVQATIFVGESRPYPQGSYYGGGSFGGYSTIQQLQIGVTLDVTPLINPDGLVVMDIHQTIENYAGFTTITGVGDVPITTRKEAQAKVAVRDRDTIMLGGLIETDKSKQASGVPFLMDIPLLGYLFRSSGNSETRKELIVLIRPTVLPTPEVAALTAKAEKDRMPGVRQAEKEINDEEAARLKQSDKQFRK